MPSQQCAAVKTQFLSMTDPPQAKPMFEPESTASCSWRKRRTVQGQLCGVTSTPFTIRSVLPEAVHVASPKF